MPLGVHLDSKNGVNKGEMMIQAKQVLQKEIWYNNKSGMRTDDFIRFWFSNEYFVINIPVKVAKLVYNVKNIESSYKLTQPLPIDPGILSSQ